jgi:hypothetical protein
VFRLGELEGALHFLGRVTGVPVVDAPCKRSSLIRNDGRDDHDA